MKVILVGNGTSVLDYKYGCLIDSFDIVVRFNDFRIKGFEEYVGKKTDCWVTCGDAHLEEINKFDRVVLHTWEYEHSLFVKEFGKRKFEITNKSEVSKIPIEWPSTGLIAIYHFIKEFGYVTIVGFDWWEREKHHYGDDIPKEAIDEVLKELTRVAFRARGNRHRPKKEYKIIKRLIEEQKLNFLTIDK